MTTDINMTFGFKIKISSPMIEHDLEIFPIKGGDFMGTITGFNMPCVRAYYNGTNEYMLPSFISAQLTFMGPDMKYFAG